MGLVKQHYPIPSNTHQYTISAEHAQSRETSRLRVTSSVSTPEMLSTNDVSLGNVDGSLFHFKFDLSCGIMTNMGKTEGIFLNLQCGCHRVASIYTTKIHTFVCPPNRCSYSHETRT